MGYKQGTGLIHPEYSFLSTGTQFLSITTSALYNLVLTIAMLPMAAKENIRYWDHETPAGMFKLLLGGLAFDRNVDLLGFDVS